MPFCVLRSSLDRLKSNFSFVHNLGDKPWRALGDVRYFRWKCPLDEDEYHLFPLFLAYILRLRCPPWKTWNWWNLLIAHIGHMDNRESIQTNRKCFERENRYWPYQRSSTYSAILFLPVESTEKGLAYSMILTKISDILFWRRTHLLCILRDRRQETEHIWSNSAYHFAGCLMLNVL